MPSSYPSEIDSYETKTDLIDDVLAEHVNELQSAVTAIETELGTTPKGAYASVKAYLAAITTLLGTSPNGNYADVAARLAAIDTGWIEDSTTWTYAGGTTATRTGATITQFPKGVKLRYKQGGSYKYAYGIGVSGTTITVVGDGFTNAAITNVAYSYMANPQGFPQYMSYTPASVGLTSPVYNGRTGYYWFVGGVCHVRFMLDIQSWSGQTGYILASLPFAPQAINLAGVATYFRTGGSAEQGTHGSYLYNNACAMENAGVNNLISWESSARITYSGTIDIMP